jgi:hypothetical protein
MKNLKSLKLNGCEIGSAGISHLSKFSWKNIKLYLCNCTNYEERNRFIGDDLKMITKMAKLREIFLDI